MEKNAIKYDELAEACSERGLELKIRLDRINKKWRYFIWIDHKTGSPMYPNSIKTQNGVSAESPELALEELIKNCSQKEIFVQDMGKKDSAYKLDVKNKYFIRRLLTSQESKMFE